MTLTGKQRYRQAVLKANILPQRSIRKADRDQKAGRSWVILGQTDRKCLEAEFDRAYEAGLRHGAQTERQQCIDKLRRRAIENRRRRDLYDDEPSQIACLEAALEAHSCADELSRGRP